MLMEKSADCESVSLLSELKRRQMRYKEQLASVTEAIEALEANPEVTKVLELIVKAN